MVDAAGRGEPRRVTEGADARHLRWHPTDGTMLVSGFWGAGGLSIRAVPLDGGTPRPLNPGPEFGLAARSGGFDLFPDGRKIAYNQESAAGDLWIVSGRPGSY
jgi:hypothetical protein